MRIHVSRSYHICTCARPQLLSAQRAYTVQLLSRATDMQRPLRNTNRCRPLVQTRTARARLNNLCNFWHASTRAAMVLHDCSQCKLSHHPSRCRQSQIEPFTSSRHMYCRQAECPQTEGSAGEPFSMAQRPAADRQAVARRAVVAGAPVPAWPGWPGWTGPSPQCSPQFPAALSSHLHHSRVAELSQGRLAVQEPYSQVAASSLEPRL
mmetsp:Transcript_109507/g.349339  ORF Transcript_109507/g.349339 Transcript_109507/m.349339 type:complete len:208 (+) Transcript_109507:132-755(+)